MRRLSLAVLRNTNFSDLYKRLLANKSFTKHESETLLKIAVVLLHAGDLNSQDLGYRVILLYSNLH